jgi:hypothetical protein
MQETDEERKLHPRGGNSGLEFGGDEVKHRWRCAILPALLVLLPPHSLTLMHVLPLSVILSVLRLLRVLALAQCSLLLSVLCALIALVSYRSQTQTQFTEPSLEW